MRKKIIRANPILFMSFLTFFIGLNNVDAQEVSTEKNEIRVSVSDAFILTLTESFSSNFVSAIATAIGDKGEYKLKNSSFGMLHLNYQRHISNKIKVGMGFSYTKFDYQNKKSKDVLHTSHYLAIAPQIEYSYIRKNFFELYSNASIGLNKFYSTIDKKTISNYGTAFQINPIGIRVGKSLGGFLEAGYGYNGFVNFGVSYKF